MVPLGSGRRRVKTSRTSRPGTTDQSQRGARDGWARGGRGASGLRWAAAIGPFLWRLVGRSRSSRGLGPSPAALACRFRLGGPRLCAGPALTPPPEHPTSPQGAPVGSHPRWSATPSSPQRSWAARGRRTRGTRFWFRGSGRTIPPPVLSRRRGVVVADGRVAVRVSRAVHGRAEWRYVYTVGSRRRTGVASHCGPRLRLSTAYGVHGAYEFLLGRNSYALSTTLAGGPTPTTGSHKAQTVK